MENLVSERYIRILEFTNTNPIFKGIGLIVLGLIALLFAYYMKKKWHEPKTLSFNIFIGLAVFIILYGAFILVFRPAWWIPFWWNK